MSPSYLKQWYREGLPSSITSHTWSKSCAVGAFTYKHNYNTQVQTPIPRTILDIHSIKYCYISIQIVVPILDVRDLYL